ncbi:GNAT family N-acetyltransferase [Bacteriovoracaceae bacterium]|nr:GNAT family N-acetyltransferase [Bacteriovoracaceae bacterium]
MNSKSYSNQFQLHSIASCHPNQISLYYKKKRNFHLSTSPKRSENFFTDHYWKKAIPIHLEEQEKESAIRFFILNNEQVIIGNINFSNIQGFPIHSCNLGYSLDEDYTGKGIMTYFLNQAIEFVFHKTSVHKVFANHTPWNISSARVLNKLGFSKIGECKDYLLINDNWEDHVLNVLFKK